MANNTIVMSDGTLLPQEVYDMALAGLRERMPYGENSAQLLRTYGWVVGTAAMSEIVDREGLVSYINSSSYAPLSHPLHLNVNTTNANTQDLVSSSMQEGRAEFQIRKQLEESRQQQAIETPSMQEGRAETEIRKELEKKRLLGIVEAISYQDLGDDTIDESISYHGISGDSIDESLIDPQLRASSEPVELHKQPANPMLVADDDLPPMVLPQYVSPWEVARIQARPDSPPSSPPAQLTFSPDPAEPLRVRLGRPYRTVTQVQQKFEVQSPPAYQPPSPLFD